jgi:transposase-like protein
MIKINEEPRGGKIGRIKLGKVKKDIEQLYSQGYSYRQIQKAMGYKSVSTISHFLKDIIQKKVETKQR